MIKIISRLIFFATAASLYLSCSKENTLPAGGTISGLSTSSVYGGDTIVITGTKFSTALSENHVTFGKDTTKAIVLNATVTSLKVIVPYLAEGTYPVNIQVKGFLPDKSTTQLIVTKAVYIWGGYGYAMYYRNNQLHQVSNCSEIYSIVGYGRNLFVLGVDNNNIPKLWVNGIQYDPIDFSKVNSAYMSSLVMAGYSPKGGDTYIGGMQKLSANSNWDLGYWKNAVFTKLVDGADNVGNHGWIYDMKMIGNDLYTTGNYRNSSGATIVKLWKNNTVVIKDSASYDFYPTNISVVGSDIYVFTSAGWCYKNGSRVNLNIPAGMYPYWGDTNGSDFYTVGYRYNSGYYANASFVKNGNETILDNSVHMSFSAQVEVSGQDVYYMYTDSDQQTSYFVKNGSNLFTYPVYGYEYFKRF